jgi:hypothetical protein
LAHGQQPVVCAGHSGACGAAYNPGVRGTEFDELAFFQAIDRSGARALLIGRRALVVLGLPVLTADYDFWIASDDIEAFNGAAAAVDLLPTTDAEAARGRGRYVLENDEHVDVLVARVVPTVEGVAVAFDDLWHRRRAVALAPGVPVQLPALDDLILTKRFANRPKDLEDIRLLTILKQESEE